VIAILYTEQVSSSYNSRNSYYIGDWLECRP